MIRIEELRASGGCTCGSGAHPRDCVKHPERYAEHVREIEEDAELDRRAEVASSGSPAGEGSGGKPTPCRGVDEGLVGSVGDSGHSVADDLSQGVTKSRATVGLPENGGL